MNQKYDYPKTRAQLNQLVADLEQVQTNVHQVHWYMRGKQFFNLHPQMDEFNETFADELDEVAERLISLNGAPFATTHEFIEHTGLPDEKIDFGQYTLPELMQRLVENFRYLRDQFQKAIEITDEENDQPTQDIINGFKSDIDKKIWMLTAYLDESPFSGE
ncbi:DNA starvation/stationary phase protection protein [Ligilactobacillus pabuli]|uniref:DNA starvation/stationary phase protection protein n=1 Tax=Ligilactobacillus pabuli TaxID=2886039 RepID=A0ABQ5JGS9_9LACO|nr:Dps family protein [Ligilactobacillus pabuli]GKS81276.1 DNA starvation/stationary phase protection protein [Ligilactobacillus pabuli]HIW89168.1 DNA starvation/stationary phase protection protein [Candidatus Ligilactobacillus excrementipullorum]